MSSPAGEAGGLAGQATTGREEETLPGTLVYPAGDLPAQPLLAALPLVPCLRPTPVPVGCPPQPGS